MAKDNLKLPVEKMIANLGSFTLKLSCDSRFQRAFTACSCVFKVITLIGSNQCNFFENATSCSKRTLKTTVATQLYYTNLQRRTSLLSRNKFNKEFSSNLT